MVGIHLSSRITDRVERFRRSAAARYGIDEKAVHIGHIALEGMLDDPDMICQIDYATGQQETNRSVAKRTRRLASAMVKSGLKPGDPAIIMGNNHIDLCIPFYACHFGGYPVCAIDSNAIQNDLLQLFPYLHPKIVFCQKSCVEKIQKTFKQTFQKGEIVVFDDPEADLVAFSKKYSGTEINYRPAEIDHSKTTAWLLMTSGTTSLPKVGIIPYDTLLNGIINWWLPFSDKIESTLAMATLQWVSSLIYLISGPLKGITRIQCSEPLTPQKLVAIINQYRPTTMGFTPYLLGQFLNAAENTCDLSCFKCIVIAGSAMEKPLLDRLKKVCNAFIYLVYGMTELLGPIFDYDDYTPFGSTGKPKHQYQFRLMDDDGMPFDEANRTGELWVKGDTFFKGYLNNPEETKTMLTDDGWLKTGDMFYKDEQDYYYFVERKRLLIKHYGFLVTTKLSPLQMERAARRHPSVVNACVVGLPQLDYTEMPVVGVIRRNDDNINVKDIFDLIRKDMEGKRVDGGLFFLPSLPVTPSGKVHRAKVKEMALAAQKAQSILFE